MSESDTAPTDPFFSEAFQTEPAAIVARMREEDPVHYIEGLGAWIVTRWDDVRELFTSEHVTNDRRAWEHSTLPPEGTAGRWLAENNFFAAAPDQHARMRRLVAAALTPRAVKRMEQQVRDVVEQFAAPLRGRAGVVDLYAEFTEPIPNAVIGRITGVPSMGDDERRWREIGRLAVRNVSPFLSPEERGESEQAMEELCAYIRELAAKRRSQPEGDLVSDLVLAHDADDRMSNDEIVMVVASLVAAGTETTTIGGTRGIRTLLQHPEQMETLRDDRSLMPNAVDELLRFDFGSLGMPRYALRDFELRGKQIRKGQLLLLSFLGAHRDPAVFPDPDRLDLRRDTKALTIFGHGPHFCLGANLARQELGLMFDAALDFLPAGSKLIEEDVRWVRFAIFDRIESLPVEIAP
ncbi:MAG: cytochrome P450 [Myxococcales bacterium]|nr:cytochrome P450 [Myxococcales bacterium]